MVMNPYQSPQPAEDAPQQSYLRTVSLLLIAASFITGCYSYYLLGTNNTQNQVFRFLPVTLWGVGLLIELFHKER